MRGRARVPCGTVEPSAKAVAHINRLIAQRDRSETRLRDVEQDLHRAVREVCDEQDVSERELAAALGVGRSTVHGWKLRGRQLAQ